MALALLGSLISSPSWAGDPAYCELWAREYTRIEICSGTRFVTFVDGTGLMFMGVADESLARATPELAEKRRADRLRECKFMVEFDRPLLPHVACSEDQAWAVGMSRLSPGDQGTVPAGGKVFETGMSGFPVGSTDWLAWCRREYRSWDEKTRTVVRRGNPDRVPCPG